MRAVIADAQDEDALCDLDIGSLIMCIFQSENVEASIMANFHC